MSSFKRTLSGLGNQHLFYNVDLVVFLEGGSVSYNKADVYAGNFTAETEDIIFWKNIFEKFSNNKKIKFKSIGSKKTIKEIAIDIVNGKLATVYVAMDNEFDEILLQRMEHSNVFYTNGYSWENDVWNQNVVKGVINELTAVEIENSDIEQNFNQFLKNMKVAVYADGYLFKNGSSFFPRKSGYMFCVDCTPIDLPTIKQLDISNKLQAKNLKKSTLYSYGSRHSIDTLKFCYGHLLADYCCQLITHYIKKRHSLTNISKDIIYRMGLKKFFQLHFDNGHIYEYYEAQFKKNGL
jgi:hypothetical protein